MSASDKDNSSIKQRFRGFLPVVVDVETAGFRAEKDALLELAAIAVSFDEHGQLSPQQSWHYHLEPFPGSHLDPKALEFNGIKPDHPFRFAKKEKEALSEMFSGINAVLHESGCQRAILVGHNAAFDLSFLLAAAKRCGFKRTPFHAFSTLDTVSLGALAYGQTVLAKACKAAGISFDPAQAHNALYDTQKTAELFCKIVNKWDALVAALPL
jgi:ribonuclease T